MKMWIACALFIATALTPSHALRCYSCAGIENIPSAAQSAFQNLPGLSSLTGTSGTPTCSSSTTCDTAAGSFCSKYAVKRSVTIGGKVYSNTMYTKGCQSSTTTLVNGVTTTITTGQCYTVSTSTSAGITTETMNCYCNNKDDCNGAATKAVSILAVIIGVFTALFM